MPSLSTDEHIYIVTYDIGEPRRWRRLFKLMHGYGEWLQLSVIQCRLTRRRRVELAAAISEVINHNQDHVLILDLGARSRRVADRLFWQDVCAGETRGDYRLKATRERHEVFRNWGSAEYARALL